MQTENAFKLNHPVLCTVTLFFINGVNKIATEALDRFITTVSKHIVDAIIAKFDLYLTENFKEVDDCEMVIVNGEESCIHHNDN